MPRSAGLPDLVGKIIVAMENTTRRSSVLGNFFVIEALHFSLAILIWRR